MLIAALDTTAYNIHNDFESSFNFIDGNICKTNVLVHCEKGISRSPTIVIAYIMRKEKKIYSDILEQVRVKRQQINPNGAFFFYLGKYSDELKDRFKEEFQKNYEKKP
jgi:protein-tyrosine phosphatase